MAAVHCRIMWSCVVCTHSYVAMGLCKVRACIAVGLGGAEQGACIAVRLWGWVELCKVCAYLCSYGAGMGCVRCEHSIAVSAVMS